MLPFQGGIKNSLKTPPAGSCRLSRCWCCASWTIQQSHIHFPKDSCPTAPSPQGTAGIAGIPGVAAHPVGSSKPVSNPSRTGTMHFSPCRAAQLRTRPSSRFPCQGQSPRNVGSCTVQQRHLTVQHPNPTASLHLHFSCLLPIF